MNVSAGQPLKVTLVWNDYPGHGVINNLDLRVVAPDSTLYLGNAFDGGHSVPWGPPDKYDNDEQVLIPTPMQGEWHVQILATNVPKGPQPYALVVTGGIENATKKTGDSGPTVISTDPKNRASAVPITTNISATFDRAMNASSAESAYSMSPSANGTFT